MSPGTYMTPSAYSTVGSAAVSPGLRRSLANRRGRERAPGNVCVGKALHRFQTILAPQGICSFQLILSRTTLEPLEERRPLGQSQTEETHRAKGEGRARSAHPRQVFVPPRSAPVPPRPIIWFLATSVTQAQTDLPGGQAMQRKFKVPQPWAGPSTAASSLTFRVLQLQIPPGMTWLYGGAPGLQTQIPSKRRRTTWAQGESSL